MAGDVVRSLDSKKFSYYNSFEDIVQNMILEEFKDYEIKK